MMADNRKKIFLSEIPELHMKSRAILEGIAASGQPVYLMGGAISRVVKNEDDNKAKIEPLSPYTMRHETSRACRCLKMKPGDGGRSYYTEIIPPLDVMRDALAAREIPLPSIVGILSHPTMSEGGEIINKAGYNPETKFYIDADAEILKAAENIPAAPTSDEFYEAGKYILEVIQDFPFKSEADIAGYFAFLLTLILLPLIKGPIPLFLIKAPAPGTGKSLLTDTALIITTGRESSPTPWPKENEEELKKTLHSLFLSGVEYILLDNVNTKINSGALAAVATTRRLSCRLLGASIIADVPCNAPIVITANNPDLSRENARRCVVIEVASDFENPAERTVEFKHPDLRKFVLNNRAGLIRACLVMARTWFAGGCDTSGVKILPSFEGWSRTIGGILKACGIIGFLENTGKFFSAADEEVVNFAAFAQAWYNEKGEYPVLVKNILHIAREYGFADERKPESSQAKSLGHILKRKQDMVFSGVKITRGDTFSGGVMTWKTVKI